MEQELFFDTVIVGAGVAGLYTALHLPQALPVLLICKEDLDSCDSMLAQGGICVQHDENDYESFFEDTLRAGHYENRRESVDLMIRHSREVIDHLCALGVPFDRSPEGELLYTREGAHSRPRICFHQDRTGEAITKTLQRHVLALPNVTVMEYTTMTDLLVENGVCKGITAKKANGGLLRIHAANTVLATGGIGGRFEHSTNFPGMTGDALDIAEKHGIALQDLDYIQFHPTSLYKEESGRSFLISESTRGEGAILLNGKGERFTDELQPRDVVAKAIWAEMEKEGSRHVWLSFEKLPRDTILQHFPTIYQTCLAAGYDITREPIPVVPAQHYFMGGIRVDQYSRTTMPHLYAVGETSCNGVHGKNRLASNSLLEALVFAKQAAQHIAARKED